MTSVRRAELAGQTLAPTIVFIGYGIVKFFKLGTAGMYWPDTYLAVFGGLASWLAVIVWDLPRGPGLLRTLCAFSACAPLLYSLYAILYLGAYTVYCSIFQGFSVLGIIFGLVCIFLGYRMAVGLQGYTTPQAEAA